MRQFIKCRRCHRDQYPNQLRPVETTMAAYPLCPDCEARLLALLRELAFLAFLIRTTLTLGEIVRIDKEKAARYAAERYREEVAA